MAIVALCAWAARVSWSPDNEIQGDDIRASVVEACDEYDAMRAEIAALKAEVSEQTARAEKAEALVERAEVAFHAEMARAEKAEAACAEMRAALEDWHGPPNPEHSVDYCPTCALLSRPDPGAGMVLVEREVLERWRAALEDTLDEIMETWATCEVLCVGKGNTVSSGCVDRVRAAIADLDALIKQGGG